MDNYISFLSSLDKRLGEYYENHSEFICCKKGCSFCCQKGDYPISELELRFLMLGYSNLNNDIKIKVQNNFKNMLKGEACPFLVDKECSVYNYRPIICRVHGLAYFYKDSLVKVPYCVNEQLNYAKVFDNGEILIEPISENLDTKSLLKDFDNLEIRNLYDWIYDKNLKRAP